MSHDQKRPATARIEPLTDTAELLALAEQQKKSGFAGGSTLNIFGTLAHNPRVFQEFSRLGGVLLMRGSVPARERELVILRVGWNARAVYEFGQHTLMGRREGLTDAEIRAVTKPLDEGSWTPVERALLALADDLHEQDCVSDATWETLRGAFDDSQLVELLVLAGYYRLVSGFLNSAGVQLDEGVPGWPA